MSSVEMPYVMCRVLLCMLEAVQGALRLLEGCSASWKCWKLCSMRGRPRMTCDVGVLMCCVRLVHSGGWRVGSVLMEVRR